MFKLWKRSLDLMGSHNPPYQDILDNALEWYSNMKIAGEWLVNSTGIQSSFKSEQSRSEHTPPAFDQETRKKSWSTSPDSTCTKVSSNPDRFEKSIGSKTAIWCGKCGDQNSSGRWITSHFPICMSTGTRETIRTQDQQMW